MSKDLSLKYILTDELIRKTATPANFKYGKAIYERGGVEIIEHNPDMVEAWVGGLNGTVVEGGGQRRRTQLFIIRGSLAWHCAGNPKKHDIFCKHCVALALTLSASKQK